MDPVQKLWMYENWVADQKQNAELAKNHAYLLASFWDPEAVKNIIGGNTIEITDEEFEDSSRIVREQSLMLQKQQSENKKRRRRKSKE